MNTILGILLVIAGLAILLRRFMRPKRPRHNRHSRARGNKSIDLSSSQSNQYDYVETCSEPRVVSRAEPAVTPVAPEPVQASRVVAMSVMAVGQPFDGYALLQALLASAMRFGERDIFHRYEGTPQAGNIVFSLASIKKPGTFDLPSMGEFTTPGLLLFMQTTDSQDAVTAFDAMVQTAQQLADTLGGQLADESRRPLDATGIAALRDSLMVVEAV